ncbi:hypothetical protein [Salibacterium aidingense]|uniref:hypothetical protein n=1 Tax=Salibacterium aidingense TaxID=384933 RepID=UPI003BDE2F8D
MKMNPFNLRRLGISILICCCFLIWSPGRYLEEGMGRYIYGFPFTTITIYQREPGGRWFSTNFFSGNDGLLVNPLGFIVNILLIYLLLGFIIRRILHKREEKHKEC